MTHEQLNAIGFIVTDRQISEVTYKEYLQDYGSDETTSPNGIAARLHIRMINDGYEYVHISKDETISEDEFDALELEEQEMYNMEECFKHAIYSWGVGGNHPYATGEVFETNEEAEMSIYDSWEYYVQNKSSDAPLFFESENDAIQDLADTLDMPFDIIERYISFCTYCRKKEAQRKAELSRQYAEQKAALNTAIENEASLINPDEEFITAVKAAGNIRGEEKSKYLSAAFVGLLSRLNYGKVKSDFWKVFRIVSKK